jgi:hypothetical protein
LRLDPAARAQRRPYLLHILPHVQQTVPVTFRSEADSRLSGARQIRRHPPRAGSDRLAAPEQTETRSLTVGQWIDRHITALCGVERKTIAEYRRYPIRDIGPTLGDVPLKALNHDDVSGWVNALRDAGNSGKSIQNTQRRKRFGRSGPIGAEALPSPYQTGIAPRTTFFLPLTPHSRMAFCLRHLW